MTIESQLGGLSSGHLDEQNSVIRGAKLLGLESKNGYGYPYQTLKKAHEQKLWEGVVVNVDHAARDPKGRATNKRGVVEGWGVTSNTELRADGIYGDVHYNPDHHLTKSIVWWMQDEARSKLLGFSHVAGVQMNRPKKGSPNVESIEKVFSVDVVRDPATTAGVFEDEDFDMKVTVRSFSEHAKSKKIRSLLESVDESLTIESTGDESEDMLAAIECAMANPGPYDGDDDSDSGDDTDTLGSNDSGSADENVTVSRREFEALQEAVGELRQESAKRDRRQMIASVLEQFGKRWDEVPTERQQLIEQCRDQKSVETLAGTWWVRRSTAGERSRVAGKARESFSGTNRIKTWEEIRTAYPLSQN